jgi:branched-chain amino acid transport system permease protein
LAIDAGLCSIPAAEARRRLAETSPLIAIGVFLASLALGALVGGAFGYLASYPALRLKEDYLAISLIFIGEIGRVVARNEEGIACGLVGLTGVPNPFIWLGDPNAVLVAYTVLVLILTAVIYLYVQRLSNSPFGRLLKSVRDDELASMVLGKNVPRARGWAMVIGSSIAAVAGVLKVYYAQGVFADDYIPLITFIVLSMVILGGMANNRGVVLGALIVTMLDFMIAPSFFRLIGFTLEFDVTYVKYIITGLVIVLVLLFRPQGIIPEAPVRTPGLEEVEKKRAK